MHTKAYQYLQRDLHAIGVPELGRGLGNNEYPEYLLQNGALEGNGQAEFVTIGTMRRISFPYVVFRKLKNLTYEKYKYV